MGELMEWAPILAYMSGTMDQELLLRNEYLTAENQILRGQLKGRPKLSDAQRAKLGEIGRRLGRKALGDVATAALPDTILGWYRRLVARKFDGSKHRSPGRPRVDRAIEELIVLMAEENRSWGYDRIVGRWPIWDLRSPTKRWEMFCDATVCRPRRSASARPHGRPSF
jgi:putative transposase